MKQQEYKVTIIDVGGDEIGHKNYADSLDVDRLVKQLADGVVILDDVEGGMNVWRYIPAHRIAEMRAVEIGDHR